MKPCKSVSFNNIPEYIPVSKVKYSHTWRKVNDEKPKTRRKRHKIICSTCNIL